MKAGVIGRVEGDFDRVSSFAETVSDGDTDLERCLDIERVFSLPSGEAAFAGRAAREEVRDRTVSEIDGGEIRSFERSDTVTRSARFVGIPGEFVVAESTRGQFAFDLIAADTGTTIERAPISLDAFFDRHPTSRPWKAGFYGNGNGNDSGTDGVSGVFHGSDLRETHDLDAVLSDSRLNQLGLAYEYDGRELKMTAAESGYVEVYAPREFTSGDYLDYLDAEIIPHVA